MTAKEHDRLLILETKFDSVKNTVDEMKEQLKNYFENNAPECRNRITSLKTQTKFQWWIIGTFAATLIGGAIKLFTGGGHGH